jgi:hypothetical protein
VIDSRKSLARYTRLMNTEREFQYMLQTQTACMKFVMRCAFEKQLFDEVQWKFSIKLTFTRPKMQLLLVPITYLNVQTPLVHSYVSRYQQGILKHENDRT